MLRGAWLNVLRVLGGRQRLRGAEAEDACQGKRAHL
jgi:hypothetical protein